MLDNKIFKVIIGLIMTLVVLVIGYIMLMIITNYRPKSEIDISIENNQSKKLNIDDDISMTTFNIGYCGTDKDIDFFMDGGTQSRSISKERTVENLNGIIKEMKTLDSDIYMLQEVDKKATRSYKVNQYEELKSKFRDYGFMFSINYKVLWVPIPLSNPHGNVLAGLSTMSKYNIKSTTRYDLPGKESYFRQLGDLDRCMSVHRIPVKNNKELVMINAHLSAYDKGGNIRREQLGFVKSFLESEYKKGNYVIIGGDWNQQIPGTDFNDFKTTQQKPDWLQDIPKEFNPEGFSWAYDKKTPTCRSMDIKYQKNENLLAIIDGFLVSDNIIVNSVNGKNLEFKNTDHNPVTINFKLK